MSTQTQDQSPIWASYEDFCTLDTTRHPEHDVVAELEVENTTPTMIGDWQGHHHVRLEGLDTNCDRQHFHIPTLLTAKPLVGKMRWLLKRLIILAGLADDLEQAETAIKIQVTDHSKNKTYRMGLVEFLFGKIGQSSKDISWTAAYTIQAIPKYKPTGLNDLAYTSIEKKDVWKKLNNRYKLITIGLKDSEKRIYLLPIRPGVIKSLIVVRRRKILAYSDIKAINNQLLGKENLLSKLDELVLLLIHITVSYIGIGKASTRGFGRFRTILKNKAPHLEDIMNLFYSTNEIEHLQNYIAEIFNRVIRILTELNHSNGSYYVDFTEFIELIDIDSSLIDKIINTKLNSTKDKDNKDTENRHMHMLELALIESIALSTLKRTWRKMLNNIIKTKGNYSKLLDVIWVLGLTRAIKGIKKRGINHLMLGYVVLKRHPDDYEILDDKELYNKYYDEKTRLVSHITIFPYLAKNSSSNNKLCIVLIKFPLIKIDVQRLLNNLKRRPSGLELGVAHAVPRYKNGKTYAKISYLIDTLDQLDVNVIGKCGKSCNNVYSRTRTTSNREEARYAMSECSLCVSSCFIRMFLEGRY